MAALTDEVFEKIKRYCALGDSACEKRDYRGAIRYYRDAFKLIPEPQTDWKASTWVLTAISDAYLLNGDFDSAREALEYAVHCPDGLGNAYIHLRLGQAQFELGNMDRAADELARAYMGGGKRMFEGQGQKYFDFLKTRMILDDTAP